MAVSQEIDGAVQPARLAQLEWAAAAPGARRDVLNRVASAVRARSVELAAMVSLEMGMPIRTSVAGVLAAADWFAYYAGWADKIEGLVAPVSAASAVHDYAVPAPYGVVGAISPWNGPAMALAVKVAPALAAGNAVVLKPSEFAPFSGVAFAQVATEAGLPAGLMNVIGGGPSVGAELCQHPGVGIISFTGGNVGGQSVGRAAAEPDGPSLVAPGRKIPALVVGHLAVGPLGPVAARPCGA